MKGTGMSRASLLHPRRVQTPGGGWWLLPMLVVLITTATVVATPDETIKQVNIITPTVSLPPSHRTSAATHTTLRLHGSSTSTATTHSHLNQQFMTATTTTSTSVPLIGRGSSLVGVIIYEMLFAYQLANDWPKYQQLRIALENGTEQLPTTQPNNSTALFFTTSTGIQTGYTPSGSGDGKTNLIAGNIDFACSDSSFSSAQFASTPDLQMLPSLATAVVIVYNLPELNSLSASTILLSREVLVQIFAGNITQWNDASIASLQTSEIAALLPPVKIKVVVRLDGSGTSNIFTHALSSFSPVWAAQVGAADSPAWPTALNPIRAKLSTGVNSVVAATPYALSYSPLGDANDLDLSIADLVNMAGTRVSPTSEAINAALLEQGGDLDEHSNAQLVDSVAPSSYPIVGYTYFAVRLNYTRNGSCASRALLLRFLTFFYNSEVTKATAKTLGFETLPSVLTQQFMASLISHLTCEGETALLEAVTPRPNTRATYSSFEVLQRLNNAYISVNTDHAMDLEIVGNSFTVIDSVLRGESSFGLVASRGFDAQTNELHLSGGATNFPVTSYPTIGVFPIAITALVPVHSITTLSATSPTLQLDYDIMTGIMLGEISIWNDSKILSINPLLDPTSSSFSGTKLPNSPITVVLYSGVSESTNIWRTQLSVHSSHFLAAAGSASDASNLTPTHPVFVDKSSRLQPTVSAIPNSIAFVQFLQPSEMVTLTADWVIHDTTSSAAIVATIAPDVSSMSECVPIVDATGTPATAEAADDERMNMVSPSAEVINPDNSLRAASYSYAYDAKNWSNAFSLDLSPNQANRATCWPFTFALYAVIPLTYTNLSRAATVAETHTSSYIDLIQPNLNGTTFLDSATSEKARLQTFAGTGEYGSLTLNWVYWLYSGGLVSQAFSHLNLLPIPTQMRLLVRSSLEHASADGSSLLINFPVDYEYSLGLSSVSYFLTALGETACILLTLFILKHRSAPIVRALSVPFCLYIILGAAMQFASLPFMTVSQPSTSTCNGLVWLLCLGFAINFGALLLKTCRIWIIMTQSRLKIVVLDNKKLSGYLALLVSAFLIVLITWTVHAPLIATFVTDSTHTPAVVHQQCGSANGALGQTYMWVLLAMCLVLVLAATVIAILVRNVASEFNESKLLGLSIYVCLILLLVVTLGVVLLWGGYLRDAYTMLMMIGVFCNNMGMLGLMLGTKAYLVWSHKGTLTTPLTQGKTSQHRSLNSKGKNYTVAADSQKSAPVKSLSGTHAGNTNTNNNNATHNITGPPTTAATRAFIQQQQSPKHSHLPSYVASRVRSPSPGPGSGVDGRRGTPQIGALHTLITATPTLDLNPSPSSPHLHAQVQSPSSNAATAATGFPSIHHQRSVSIPSSYLKRAPSHPSVTTSTTATNLMSPSTPRTRTINTETSVIHIRQLPSPTAASAPTITNTMEPSVSMTPTATNANVNPTPVAPTTVIHIQPETVTEGV